MKVDVSSEGWIGRVSAVATDHNRAWIRLAEGGSVAVTASGRDLDLRVGQTVFVTDYDLDVVPDEAWPADAPDQAPSREIWVGVVSLRTDDVTIVELGYGPVRRVPTTDLTYEVGNTVEGSDADGIRKVLADKPLPRAFHSELGEEDLREFRREPTGDVTFKDFGGLPAVVDRAKELIELPLLRHEQLQAIRAKPVKGVLFTGLPGTGKTMLARIIANVAGATFYEISGPSVISKWVGQSEQLLRAIFLEASERAPSIIFFDEIDSVAGRRTEEAHEASKRVVAQLLTLMDGFEADDRVTVIAATNRPQDIDVALRRPGRFDWEIEFPLPDRSDREAILRTSSDHLTREEPLPYRWLATHTEGWSAADLAAIWREAALLAVADHSRAIIMTEDVLVAHHRVGAHRERLQVQSQLHNRLDGDEHE